MDKEAQGNAENIIRKTGNELLRAWGILFSVRLTINDITLLNEGSADD